MRVSATSSICSRSSAHCYPCLRPAASSGGVAATTLQALLHRPAAWQRGCRLPLWYAIAPRCHASAAAEEEPRSRLSGTIGSPHIPVLLQEVLHHFSPLHVKVYVDGTLGAGGHACAMLRAHPEMELLVGVDCDPTAHAIAGARLRTAAGAATAGSGSPRAERMGIHQLRGNYCDMIRLLESVEGPPLVGCVDAMLLDLGVSSMQVDTPDRGFSFSADGPLDMRLDPDAVLSAEQVVNTWSEADLGRVLRVYGEEKMWRLVARRIAAARELSPIRTTAQLAEAVGHTQLRPKGKSGSTRGRASIHPATRTFQALRIVVNDELRRLEQALPAAISCLAPRGRLAVISFHSLEDRLVKHAFLRAAGRPTPAEEELTHGPEAADALETIAARAVGRLVTRKPVLPQADEQMTNPRARSAKLRVFEHF